MPEHYTPWQDGVTEYKATDMNVPLEELDVAIVDVETDLGENYYTKTDLQTSGEAEVHWDNITDAPPIGGGDVVGPAENHDGYVPQWDGADSKTLKDGVLLGDSATLDIGTTTGTVAAGDHTHDQPYDVVGYFPTKPTNGQLLFVMRLARAVTLPASLTGSKADLQTAATAETVFSIKKGGVEFGTITFAISGTTGTFASASGASFAAGDILTIYGPASADATAAGLSWTLIGSRS